MLYILFQIRSLSNSLYMLTGCEHEVSKNKNKEFALCVGALTSHLAYKANPIKKIQYKRSQSRTLSLKQKHEKKQ